MMISEMFEIKNGDFFFGLFLVIDALSAFKDGLKAVLVVVGLEQGIEIGFVDFVCDWSGAGFFYVLVIAFNILIQIGERKWKLLPFITTFIIDTSLLLLLRMIILTHLLSLFLPLLQLLTFVVISGRNIDHIISIRIQTTLMTCIIINCML